MHPWLDHEPTHECKLRYKLLLQCDVTAAPIFSVHINLYLFYLSIKLKTKSLAPTKIKNWRTFNAKNFKCVDYIFGMQPNLTRSQCGQPRKDSY